MGVFKWLRRERTPVSHRETGYNSTQSPSDVNRNTVRTEEYNQAYNQFLARRSLSIDPQSQEHYKAAAVAAIPNRHHPGRQSLPASCVVCSDSTEKTSDCYDKQTSAHKKRKSKSEKKLPRVSLPNNLSHKQRDGVPNIQFLFRNQVFMPGSVVERQQKHTGSHFSYQDVDEPDDLEDFKCRQLDFDEDDSADSAQPPPLFFKDNSLPFEVSNFLSPEEDVEIPIIHLEHTQHDSSDSQHSIEDKEKSDQETTKKNVDAQLQDVLNELKSFDRWADDLLQPSSGESREKDASCKKQLTDNGTGYLHMAQTSTSEVSVADIGEDCWTAGRWGVIPVHFKRLNTVTTKEQSVQEVDLLMTCRHPNILLLMGVCYNRGAHTTLIFETCIDTLYNILHTQEHETLTVQTSVRYALDIANALVFLHMQGYLHTNVSSQCVMLTNQDVAKLCNFDLCCTFDKSLLKQRHADNIEQSAEAAWSRASVRRYFQIYRWSSQFRWHAPEQFDLDAEGTVQVSTRSDAYSLSLILWECCNDSPPWKTLDYPQLGDLYLHWRVGVRLASDRYPDILLAALQQGLCVDPALRSDMRDLCDALTQAKSILHSMEDMWIMKSHNSEKESSSSSADVSNSKKSTVTNFGKDQQTNRRLSERSLQTDEEQNSVRTSPEVKKVPVKMAEIKKYVNDVDGCDESDSIAGSLKVTTDNEPIDTTTFKTPKSKKHTQGLTTPCVNLHKSDSTEYCSLFSPEYYDKCNELNRDASPDNFVDNQSNYRSNILSQTVTPKSYVPCQIKLPQLSDLDGIKTLNKNQETKSDNVSTYTFDVRNYSLPTTPIARNTKLRRNAWLSGEFNSGVKNQNSLSIKKAQEEKDCDFLRDVNQSYNRPSNYASDAQRSPPASQHVTHTRNAYSATKQRKPLYHAYSSFSSDNTSSLTKLRSRSQSFSQPGEDGLHKVNIRPLVAIHERWIMEANKKSCRSHSLPDNYRGTPNAVKPASHRLDLQSHASTSVRKPAPPAKHETPPGVTSQQRQFPVHTPTNEMHSESYAQIRDAIARKIVLPRPATTRHDHYEQQLWRKENVTSMGNSLPRNSSTPMKYESITTADTIDKPQMSIDKSTNTKNIEDWIRDTIKTEIRKMLFDSRENLAVEDLENCDEIIFRDLAAYIYAECKSSLGKLNMDGKQSTDNSEIDKTFDVSSHLEPANTSEMNKSSSVQIILKRSQQSGDHRVKVSISDDSDTRKTIIENIDLENERLNLILSKSDSKHAVLKRCQGFSAIQEARSTEDLYIDDEFSTQMDMGGICDINNEVQLVPVTGCLRGRSCGPRECCLATLQQDSTCPRVFLLCPDHRCDQDSNLSQFSDFDVDNTQLQFSDFDIPNESVLRRSVSVIEEVDEEGVTSEEGNVDSEDKDGKKSGASISEMTGNSNETKINKDLDLLNRENVPPSFKAEKLGDGRLLYVVDDNFKMTNKKNEPSIITVDKDENNCEHINQECIYMNEVNFTGSSSNNSEKEFSMNAISKITYFSFDNVENIPENDSFDATTQSSHYESSENCEGPKDSFT